MLESWPLPVNPAQARPILGSINMDCVAREKRERGKGWGYVVMSAHVGYMGRWRGSAWRVMRTYVDRDVPGIILYLWRDLTKVISILIRDPETGNQTRAPPWEASTLAKSYFKQRANSYSEHLHMSPRHSRWPLCLEPPSSPENLTLVGVTSRTARLLWSGPLAKPKIERFVIQWKRQQGEILYFQRDFKGTVAWDGFLA